MRSALRETAAAFGDEPSRDVEAEFGAPLASAIRSVATGAKGVAATVKAPAPKPSAKVSASGSVSVQAPKLAVLAPPAPKAPPAPSSVVSAGGKAAVVARPVAPAKPPSSAATYTTAANQANFLDGGSAPIALAVKAPAGTIAMTQAQRDANARALLKADALSLATANAAYARDRQANDALAMASLYDGKKEPYERAGVDWGLIPMGAKVLAVGASVIATGGAAAGALGVTAAGGSLAAAAAADRLVAAVERGGEIGKQAKDVIADVKSAAARGDKVAKDALAIVDQVTDGRIAAGVRAGVEQTLSAAGSAAVNAVAGIAGSLSGSGALDVGRAQAAMAAAGGAPSTGFVDMRPQRQVELVSNRPASAAVASLLGPGEPRWLVTPEARVVDLERSPGKATAKGFLVTTAGKVSKQ